MVNLDWEFLGIPRNSQKTGNSVRKGSWPVRYESGFQKYFVTSWSVMFALLSLPKGPEMSCFMLLMENLPMP